MTTTDPRPGFWTRLGRAFISFLKFLFLLLILVAIGLAAWVGFQELTRSLAALSDRGDITTERVELLRSDVDNLMADTADAEAVATLEAEVTALEAQVEAGNTALAADLRDQQEMLTGLQLQVAALVTETATYSETIALLRSGLVALQEDVNANNTMVDDLGGAVDRLEVNSADLETEFAQVRADAGELAQMERTLTLFRVWELLSRARLSLSEGNAGLAQSDVAAALATVNGLAEVDADPPAGDEETPLAPERADLQQRLALVLENLPQDPATATRDLQTAWDILDQMLVSLIGVAEIEATVPLTGTDTITATTPLTGTNP